MSKELALAAIEDSLKLAEKPVPNSAHRKATIAQVYATLALVEATDRQTDTMVKYEQVVKDLNGANARLRIATELVGGYAAKIAELEKVVADLLAAPAAHGDSGS